MFVNTRGDANQLMRKQDCRWLPDSGSKSEKYELASGLERTKKRLVERSLKMDRTGSNHRNSIELQSVFWSIIFQKN